jgi:hypothetical protein
MFRLIPGFFVILARAECSYRPLMVSRTFLESSCNALQLLCFTFLNLFFYLERNSETYFLGKPGKIDSITYGLFFL